MLEILFRAEVHPPKLQEFVEFIKDDALVAREQEKESGTLWFDYYEDPKCENAFFVYEAYRDEAAFDAHRKNKPYQHWDSWIRPRVLAKFQPLFEKEKPVSTAIVSGIDEKDLKKLNEQIAVMEQQRGPAAKAWFHRLLSDQLVFRRASGITVDKVAFLSGLNDANAFTSRESERMKIIGLDDKRALVVLVVRATRSDGSENLYRNIRLFSKQSHGWMLECWYNYDITAL